MLAGLYRLLPPEGAKILLVLFLSFLMGLEREERKSTDGKYSFGGVRTFPLIGLIAYAVSLLSGGQILPVVLGFAVVAAFLMLSFRHKIETTPSAGFTSEMSALATYVAAALVYREEFWIATTLTVASMLLLELKATLESLTKRIPQEEILTFTKFLLLTAVVLPVIPNQEFGPFKINPEKVWLVAVAVSAVSYGSYVVQKVLRKRGGVLLSALLGGAYSSTVTTVVLARRAANEKRPHLFAGCTMIASGMMYIRLAVLVSLFNRNLMTTLGPAFLFLAVTALVVGWAWSRWPDAESGPVEREFEPRNPLELRAALMFAGLFLVMLVATSLAVKHLGQAGVYSLGAIMGLVDVDPFIMGMTQSSGATTSLAIAASAILIAAASNNMAKGAYAWFLSDRRTGIQSLGLLVALTLAGLAPLIWIG